MRVLVCGGRSYYDTKAIYNFLNEFHKTHKIDLLIHGDATGADTIAKCWALLKGIPIRTFKANWQEYGNRAGAIRNTAMLKEGKPDIVIAFPGGHGTDHMIAIAGKAEIKVVRGI